MLSILQPTTQTNQAVYAFSERAVLDDDSRTSVHIVRYRRDSMQVRLVTFDKPTSLPEWCADRNISEALTGGFFLRSCNMLLGDHWINGIQQESISWTKPWDKTRACLNLEPGGSYEVAARHHLPKQLKGDMIQAGPHLAKNGVSIIEEGLDPEGFTAGSDQFDSDISDGRYPRTALGFDDTFIWSVVCDGRSPQDAGLTLGELAELLVQLGAQHAINLDGGGSAVQISSGSVRNQPRTLEALLPNGRPIFSALVFEASTP